MYLQFRYKCPDFSDFGVYTYVYEVNGYNKMYFKHIISIIIYQTLKTLSKWLPANKVLLLHGMCFNDSRYTFKKSKAIH